MENTVVEGGQVPSIVGAVWIFTRTADIWTQQGPPLMPNDPGPKDEYFGYTVSISANGNTVLVGERDGWGGSYAFLDTGGAWVFVRTDTTWAQQGSKLLGTGASNPACQGLSVSLSADGNTAIVGGPLDNNQAGAAWVYTRNGTTWAQQAV